MVELRSQILKGGEVAFQMGDERGQKGAMLLNGWGEPGGRTFTELKRCEMSPAVQKSMLSDIAHSPRPM